MNKKITSKLIGIGMVLILAMFILVLLSCGKQEPGRGGMCPPPPNNPPSIAGMSFEISGTMWILLSFLAAIVLTAIFAPLLRQKEKCPKQPNIQHKA